MAQEIIGDLIQKLSFLLVEVMLLFRLIIEVLVVLVKSFKMQVISKSGVRC